MTKQGQRLTEFLQLAHELGYELDTRELHRVLNRIPYEDVVEVAAMGKESAKQGLLVRYGASEKEVSHE